MDLSSCERYLRGLSSIGARVGDFYLAFGRACRPAEHDLPRGPAQQCYANAARLAFADDGLVYFEGFALQPGLIPVHHAWCVDADEKVVDTTWSYHPDTEYWGIALQTGFVHKYVLRSEVWGVLAEHVPAEMRTLHPSEYLHPRFAPARQVQDDAFSWLKP